MKVYTEVSPKEIDIALTTKDLSVQWEVFSSLDGDDDFFKLFEQVKWGVDEKFDIRAITEGQFQMEPAFGQVRIERAHVLNITDYRDEIDERKKIIKDVLRTLVDDSFDKQEEPFIKGYND